MYNIILFRYRAPGLPLEHPECSRIFTEYGEKLCEPRHCDTSTVKMSAWFRGRKLFRATPPLKNGPFVDSSLWDWLVVAVICTNAEFLKRLQVLY